MSKLFLNHVSMAAVVLTAGFSPLQAQDTESAFTLEEIIVTAQKREQSIQDVPISITTISGSFLERSGTSSLMEVATQVPNLQLAQSSQVANQRIAIRGVGSVGNSAIEGSVGVFVDGVYYPRPGSMIGSMMDIESIEVLRGPQGTLFGRNTPMGALNITTRKPSQEFEAMATASYGKYGTWDAGGYVSGGLTENLTGRVSMKYSETDGYGFNDYTNEKIGGKDEFVMRGKLRFEGSDDFVATVNGDYSLIHNTGSVVDVLPESLNPVFLATIQSLFGVPFDNTDGYDQHVYQEHTDKARDEHWGLSLDMEKTLGDVTLRSITAYRNWQNEIRDESTLRIPANMLPRNTDFKSTTFSQELQANYTGDKFDLVGGVFYYKEDFDIDQWLDAGTDFCTPVIYATVLRQATAAGHPNPAAVAQAQTAACLAAPQEHMIESAFGQELKSVALFSEVTLHATDKLDLIAGLRWSDDSKRATFEQVLNNPFGAAFRSPESAPDLKFDDNRFTWRLNASYHATDDVMLFATVSTGFKSGGFNSEGAGTPLLERRTFDSETTTNYEVGFKSKLADNRVMANVTIFRTDIDNFQDRSFDGDSFLIRNAGSLRQQGVEADFQARPLEQLTMTAGVGYLDSEFMSYDGASPLPGNTGVQDLSGRPNHFSPKWQLSSTAEWRDGIGGTELEWFIRGAVNYSSSAYIGADTNLNPQVLQSGYALANFRAGIEKADSAWRIEAYLDNAFDKGYYNNFFDQPFGSSIGAIVAATNSVVIRGTTGAPRTYGVRATYNF